MIEVKYVVVAVAGAAGFVASMFTIGMGLGRSWSQLEPAVFADTFPGTFVFLLPTIALTLPLGLYGAWNAMTSAPARSTSWKQWRLALIGLVASTLITIVYHVPANYRIWRHDLDATELSSELDRWLAFHALRVLIAGLALVAALRAALEDLQPVEGAAGS